MYLQWCNEAIYFYLPCNIIKASMADYHNEISTWFDNFVTITGTPIASQISATPPDSAATWDTSVAMDSASTQSPQHHKT